MVTRPPATGERIEAILAREFPGSAVGEVREVSGGSKSTYVASLPDRDLVVAACGPDCDLAGFAVEPGVMGLLGERTGIPVPEVLAVDLSPEGLPPYYVTTRIEGYDPSERYKYLPRGTRERLLAEAGRYLGELHREVGLDAPGRLRPDGDTVSVDPAGSWPAFLESMMGEWIDGLSGGRFADLVPTYERVAACCRERAPSGIDPVLCHFDYRPANLIVREGEIAAVLDWGLAVSGHAEYDLFKAEKNFLLAHFETAAIRDDLREHLFLGYREERDLAPGWRERRALYRVAYKLESMRSFPRWTAGMDGAERDATERTLREELDADLDRLEGAIE